MNQKSPAEKGTASDCADSVKALMQGNIVF